MILNMENQVKLFQKQKKLNERNIRDESRYTNYILAEDIKTILTKEQFDANCYKVGGEDEC